MTEDSKCAEDGTAAAEAASAVGTRMDELGDDPPPPRPREIPLCDETRSGSCATTQPDALSTSELVRSVCVASKGRSDHYQMEAPETKDGDVARDQMDIMFVGAEGSLVDEPRAKSTVPMVVCKDDGNLNATVVCTMTDEYGVMMVMRVLSTYEDVEIKTDGDPSIVEIA